MPIHKILDYLRNDPLVVIILSVVVSSVLMVYPLLYSIAGWRPHFMFLITLFWVMCQPTWCGVWFSFAMGLFTDLLLGLPLGANALSFVILGFIARLLTREFAYIPFLFLWLISGVAVLFYVLVMWIGLSLADVPFVSSRHWQPLLSSIAVFPVIFWLLKRWRV